MPFDSARSRSTVGGAHQPEVRGDGAGAADRPELTLLQDAQQLGLQRRLHLANLVEEQRAAVRELDQADLVGDGARERALAMAEQLALEQIGGDGGAVQADERLAGALAVLVDRLGDQLLAGAVLADDEHVRVSRRHHAHQAEQLLHHVALRDEPGEGRRALERGLQPAVLLDEGDPLADLVQQRREVPGVDRLFEEAEGAARHRPHRGADAAVAGDHDGLDVGMVAARVVEQLHAVGVGQDHVEEDDVGGPARERIAVGRAGGDLPHRVASAGEQHRDPGAAVDVVVEDEDAKGRGGQLPHQGNGEPIGLCTRAIGYPAHR